MHTLLKNTAKLSSLIVILSTFLAYLTPHIDPEQFRGLVFFGIAFPWLLLLNVLLLLLWTWRANRFAIYHAGIMLLGWQYVTGFIGMHPGQKNDNQPAQIITVATHNLGRLWTKANPQDKDYAELAKAYAALLQKKGEPDILCTQETRGKFYRALAREMNYPYTFNLQKGTVILSRFPILGGGEIPFEKTRNSTLWVDVEVNKQAIRIYNVHLQSNKVTNDTEKVLEAPELDNTKTWDEIRRVARKVGGATRQRSEQAKQLRLHIEECRKPVLICGDFNDPPNSFVYRHIANGFADTFQEAGFGIGSTYAGVLPFLRIDYILADPVFLPRNCRIIKQDFSDHHLVWAQLALTP